MELNKFEKHLRSSLHDMEEEVDVAKLMKGIPLIKPAKKKRGFILPSITILAVMLIGTSIFFYKTEDSMVNHHSDQVISSELVMNAESSKIPAKINSSERNSAIPNGIDIGNDSDFKLNASIKQTKKKASSILQNEKTENSYVTKSLETERKGGQVSTVENQDRLHKKETPQTQASNVALAYQLSNSYNQSQMSKDVILTKREIVTQITNLESINPQNLITNEDFYASLLTPKHVNCPTFAENPWIFDFGMVMGISKPNKTLSRKTTGIQPAYTSRATNEKSLEGLDLELFLSAKRARWPVSLKSGINYSRWSERMKIEEDYTEIDTIQGLISVTTSQTGDTVKYIYGDIYVERDVQIRKNIHYYINRLDIPVSLVYETEISGHGFQVEAGTRMNVGTFARGLIYNNQAEFTNVNKAAFFKKITGLSYFAKLHYRYYLSPRNYLGAQAYYQYLPAEFSDTSNQISQKYTNAGIGVYYGFRF